MAENSAQSNGGNGERKFADLTPYAASQIVTAMLKKAGVQVPDVKTGGMKDLVVSSQAMYSRAIKGIIASYRLGGDDGTWMFDGAAFAKWAKQYVDGYVNGTARQTRTDYAKLADEYSL